MWAPKAQKKRFKKEAQAIKEKLWHYENCEEAQVAKEKLWHYENCGEILKVFYSKKINALF